MAEQEKEDELRNRKAAPDAEAAQTARVDQTQASLQGLGKGVGEFWAGLVAAGMSHDHATEVTLVYVQGLTASMQAKQRQQGKE